jgi:hypothetical protein
VEEPGHDLQVEWDLEAGSTRKLMSLRTGRPGTYAKLTCSNWSRPRKGGAAMASGRSRTAGSSWSTSAILSARTAVRLTFPASLDRERVGP